MFPSPSPSSSILVSWHLYFLTPSNILIYPYTLFSIPPLCLSLPPSLSIPHFIHHIWAPPSPLSSPLLPPSISLALSPSPPLYPCYPFPSSLLHDKRWGHTFISLLPLCHLCYSYITTLFVSLSLLSIFLSPFYPCLSISYPPLSIGTVSIPFLLSLSACLRLRLRLSVPNPSSTFSLIAVTS